MGFFGKSPHDRAISPKNDKRSKLVADFKGRQYIQEQEEDRSNLCPYCSKRTDTGACVNSKCDAYSGRPKRLRRFL